MKALMLSSLTVLVGIGASCAHAVEPQSPCGFFIDDGERVSWKNAIPVDLYIAVDSVPVEARPEFEQAVKDAMYFWNSRLEHPILRLKGDVHGTLRPSKDGRNIIFWMSDWPAPRSREEAFTSFYWHWGQIIETDVQINAKDYTWSFGLQSGQVDLVSVLVHEFGHVLGLDHTDPSEGGVMAPSLKFYTLRREPSASNIDSLRCEYAAFLSPAKGGTR